MCPAQFRFWIKSPQWRQSLKRSSPTDKEQGLWSVWNGFNPIITIISKRIHCDPSISVAGPKERWNNICWVAGPSGAGQDCIHWEGAQFYAQHSCQSMENFNDSNHIIDGNFVGKFSCNCLVCVFQVVFLLYSLIFCFNSSSLQPPSVWEPCLSSWMHFCRLIFGN